VTGVEIDPDWKSHPPQEVWRQKIGAGWSAFSVVGDYAVTQEQRGNAELVTCYRVSTVLTMGVRKKSMAALRAAS
jgi:outer membrane protein assembly factor BamB